jgi:DNA-binding LytR/AlgR family response regulator
MNVALVDDEYLALQLLEKFIQELRPDWNIVVKLSSAPKALDLLKGESVDILFLDIQMPGLLGTELLAALGPQPPITVFTTAYAEHASTAFDLNAVDYLLKPFAFERFEQAIHKIEAQLKLRKVPQLSIKVDGKLLKIDVDNILYIEGLKEYVRIYSANDNWITLASLQKLEEELASSGFMRVHKSYIVRMEAVTALQGYHLQLGEKEIPISRSKKELIKNRLFPDS